MSTRSDKQRVVVTGVGAITPLGVGAEALFDRWSAGECGIVDGLGSCTDFDPTDFLSTKEARRSDRFTQLAIGAAEEALASAGWEADPPYPGEEVACVIGTGIGGLGSLEEQHLKLLDRGPRRISPLCVPLMMGNAAAAAVAMRRGFRGETYGTISACAAGAHAIGSAVRAITDGDATAALAGGAEATLTPLAKAAFERMGATSETGISRPFDRRRDGFVMGEGAGILLFEEAGAAEARGAEPLAEIVGYGATSDAYHLTAPEPGGAGAARAIEVALADAGLEPSEIDYINAHGTSTPLNDRSETDAIKSVFGEGTEVPISSTKSAIGHLLGAAGGVEAVATVGALRRRVAPPTVGYGEPDEGLDLDYVPDSARPLGDGNGKTLAAVSNSFGFGGHNAVLCFRST
jgi:3-oxoacyl-[acyl-carrier-protein] synthase II